ncbi:MAG: hypothetical protein IIA44_15075, partial [Acidobacteria bacterium]|nr:hypothetical protein [Acidobacteriota bacterium]
MPIDRDVLMLPDVVFDSMDCDVPQTLQPIFDALWNAAGFVRSPCYDNNGKWDQENWETRIGDSILPF